MSFWLYSPRSSYLSVLGAVLFLIYINDINDVILREKILKFADDTQLYEVVTNQDDIEILRSDLVNLCNWSKDWLMFSILTSEKHSYRFWKFKWVISTDSIRSFHYQFDTIRETKSRFRYNFLFHSISNHLKQNTTKLAFLHKQLKSPVTASMLNNNIHHFGLYHRVINSYDDHRVNSIDVERQMILSCI